MTMRAKYSGGPNLRAKSARVGARRIRPKMLTVPAMKEPKAEYFKRRTGAALTGHLIAIETSDDRGCLAWDIQQNGSRRATVHSSIANARKHDDGGNRIELES